MVFSSVMVDSVWVSQASNGGTGERRPMLSIEGFDA